VVSMAAIGLLSTAGLFDASEMVLPVSWLLTAVIVWNFYSWWLAGRRWFEPYPLFLLAAALFNGGQGILEVFQFNQKGILDGQFSADLTIQSLYLVAIGLASMHFGALAGLTGTNRRWLSTSLSEGSPAERLRSTRLVGYLCLAVSIVPMGIVLRDTLMSSIAGGYGGLYDPTKAALPGPVLAVATFMIPGTMFLIAGSRDRKAPAAIATLFVLIYAGVMLASGARTPAVMILISYAFVYEHSIRRLPRLVILGCGLGLMLTFPLIAALRSTVGFWQDPLQLLGQAMDSQNNLLVAAVAEMGGSLITVAHTINLFPSVRPFDYGISYAYSASTLIPNLGWEVHPAVAHGLLADWLIRTVSLEQANKGGGLGYSFIAEAFANFGWFGTGPLVAIVGYCLARLSRWSMDTSDPVRNAFTGTFLALFLNFSRGESTATLRNLGWYSFLPFLAVSMLARQSYKSQTRRASQYKVGPVVQIGVPQWRNMRLKAQ
jgi:oligosaccharide repeat unit polymerase